MNGPTPTPQDSADAIPVASLIVCTRNRAAQLHRTLSSLEELRVSCPWELILVDSASTDDTPRVLERFAATNALPVRIVSVQRPGLGRARNAGVRNARGHILVFTDDDCYPAPDFVDQVAAIFAENPDIGFMGGRILLFDPADYPITIRTETVEQRTRAGSLISAGFIQGANMAIRREVLESVGLFDDAFGPGTPFNCEDVDVMTRASLGGWDGMYSPRPLVYHHHGRRTTREVKGLSRSYARGRGAFYMKLILDRRTRVVGLRNWYQSQAWGFRQHGVRAAAELLREIASGAKYLMFRLRSRREDERARGY
jgi:GT2 family glycosyltransferase